MTETASTVTAALQLHLVVPGGPSLPVSALVTYRADDPWAVRVAFRTGREGDGVVEWMFARQLLTDGITTAVGEGDVRIWTITEDGERLVVIAMASPSGSALFEIDYDEVVEFLQATYVAVPTGAESLVVDLDHEMSLLLTD